jgi:hypothetical protein
MEKENGSEIFLEKHEVAVLMKCKLAIICVWLGG